MSKMKDGTLAAAIIVIPLLYLGGEGWPGQPSSWIPAIWALAGALILATIVECDLAARIVPWELALALAACGLVRSALTTSMTNTVINAGFAVAVMLLVWAASSIVSARAGMTALGGGDVMLAGAVCAYVGFTSGTLLAGLFVSSAVTAMVLLVQLARRRLKRGQLVPYAPYFAGWAAASVVAGAVA